MSKLTSQKGIAHIGLIILGLGIISGLVFLFFKSNGSFTFNDIKSALNLGMDKSDPDWLEKYCVQEIKKLPEAPHAYIKKNEVAIKTGWIA